MVHHWSLTEFVQKAACSCPHVLTDKNRKNYYQNHLPSIHGSDGSHASGGFIYQWFPHNFISRWSQIPGSFFSFPKVQGVSQICGWIIKILEVHLAHLKGQTPDVVGVFLCSRSIIIFPLIKNRVRLKIEYPIPSLDEVFPYEHCSFQDFLPLLFIFSLTLIPLFMIKIPIFDDELPIVHHFSWLNQLNPNSIISSPPISTKTHRPGLSCWCSPPVVSPLPLQCLMPGLRGDESCVLTMYCINL